jgi:hypothetical protein
MGIVVYGMGGARGSLALTYPSDPGPQKVAEDAATLAEAGEWTISTPDRTEEDGAVYYEAEMTPAVAPDESGRLPLFPFLHAFRRFPDLQLVLVGTASGPAGDFVGENRFLSVQGHRSGSITQYRVRIEDASFSGPEDTEFAEVAGTEQPAGEPVGQATPRRSTWGIWLLLATGALGTGVFVWGLTWWALSVRGARNHDAKKDKPPSAAKMATSSATDSRHRTPGVPD